MTKSDFSWAVPVMRLGYAGRGLVYLVVAGFSLWAIWRGGQAEGTKTALASLEQTGWGKVVLVLIALGMLAYAVWRALDAVWDLEAYGSGAKGMVARTGMIVTGLVHLGIGIMALTVLFTASNGGGDGSTIGRWTGQVMSWPAGRWIVGLAGLAIIGAGLYYARKAWTQKYREHLRANRFTLRWNKVLQAGVIAQAIILVVIGGFFAYAALTADPSEAGGTGEAFDWLSQQAYGQVLVTLVCIGLLGFAIFCFVNAAYRIIPKVAGDDIETLGARLKAKAGA